MFLLLLKEAERLGYDWVIEWSYRPKDYAEKYAEEGKGISNSLHSILLAIDLYLWKDDKYLTTVEEYLELGEYWESIGGSWGGRFKVSNGKTDIVHFSLEHNGVK